MIGVFCEFGGWVLLGKARELADLSGEKVIAVASESRDSQKLISLGADEVLATKAEALSEWVTALSGFAKENSGSLKVLILPAGLEGDIVAGWLFASSPNSFSSFLDRARSIDGSSAAKPLGKSGFAVQISTERSGRAALISMDTRGVPPPFEDSTRYGRVREMSLGVSSEKETLRVMGAKPSQFGSLSVIVGASAGEKLKQLARRVAEKYNGVYKDYSGRIEVVYGPCIAVQIEARLRDLPEFQGDLFSLSDRLLPISSIASASVVTEDLEKVLEAL